MTPAGREGAGDPAGVKRRGGSRSSPRKASDWSGNQRASFIVQKQQSIRKEPFKKKRPSAALFAFKRNFFINKPYTIKIRERGLCMFDIG